ncbi:MAG: NfeD family protein [Chrysiogenetes bacterium]|nr:NfeD family protein [Chrysiogenetes bacterium]
MPEGLLPIISLLVLAYLLLLAELFVPGGILGIIGFGLIVYAVTLAFEISTYWGVGTILFSLFVTIAGVVAFARSKTARRLMLSDTDGKTWKSSAEELPELLGKTGVTVSKLRPAGVADFGGVRVDVISDSEFLEAGTPIRVCLVEGNRVVVEAAEALAPEGETSATGGA